VSTGEEGSGDEGVRDADAPAYARRSPRLTKEDVFRAADELLFEGQRPTIAGLRARLGRGSPNTILEHLDSWWAKLGARVRDASAGELPGIPDRVGRSLQHLWNESLEAAREALQSALQQREEGIAAQQTALEERERSIAEQSQALDLRRGALEEALALAREQLAAANRRAETIERASEERIVEVVRLRARVAAIEGDLVRVQTLLESEREKLQERYETAETRWLMEVDRARQLAREQAQELKRLGAENRSGREERDRLQRELSKAQSHLASALAKAARMPARPPQTGGAPKGAARKGKSGRRVNNRSPRGKR
jgi:Plasmid replication region DNA-binding N-term